MINSQKKLAFTISGLLFIALLPTYTYAQSAANTMDDARPNVLNAQEMSDQCYTLDQNERWIDLFGRFSQAYVSKDYDQALSLTTDLQDICDRSPILNYSIATTYREKGDLSKALIFYHKATGNHEFSVADDLLKKMWDAQYEVQYEVDHGSPIAPKKDVEACEAKNKEILAKIDTLNEDNRLKLEEANKRHLTYVWTGVGVGATGLVLVVTGAAIAATQKPSIGLYTKEEIQKDKNKENKVKLDDTARSAGWILLGTGVGLTVAGAVVAGIAGYNYKHPITDDVTASFQVSPSNLEFGLTF